MNYAGYMKPTLLIMAAGMGNRYGGLKQLDQLGPSGETIPDYSVYNALKGGFGKVVFVVRHSFEDAFRSTILSRYTDQIATEVVFQELDALPDGYKVPQNRVRPWGTGHALLMAKEAIKEPFCVINADDYYGAEAFRTMGKALSSLNEESAGRYYTAGYRLGQTLSESGSVSRGICSVDGNNMLTDIVEHKELSRKGEQVEDAATGHLFSPDTFVSMNFWGFTPDIFASAEKMFKAFLEAHGTEEKSEFYIPSIVNGLIASGNASFEVLPTADSWFGVTYSADRPMVVDRLKAMHEQGIYPTPLIKRTNH